MRIQMRMVLAVLFASSIFGGSAYADFKSELKQNIKWSIFHEGCHVFYVPQGKGPLEDEVLPASNLRQCYYNTQQHNQGAQNLIAEANDDLLLQVTMEAIQEIPDEFHLFENFQWVADHEGQEETFRVRNGQGNYESIRSIYFEKQRHNPNAADLLSAVSNRYIRDMINAL